MHQFVQLDSSFKQSFILPFYIAVNEILIVLLKDSPDISVVGLSSGTWFSLFF